MTRWEIKWQEAQTALALAALRADQAYSEVDCHDTMEKIEGVRSKLDEIAAILGGSE